MRKYLRLCPALTACGVPGPRHQWWGQAPSWETQWGGGAQPQLISPSPASLASCSNFYESPTHRSGAYTWPASSAQSTGGATWLPRISLAHTLPLAMAADAPGCEAMTPVLSTTCACDTVNLPEFPIMYLFWVLTLCTETAAHGCFFTKKNTQKTMGKEDTSFYALFGSLLCLHVSC